MVASISDPGLITTVAALGRPGSTRIDTSETTSGRVVAATAKFGPDPVHGSPFQFVTGDDVKAAETNDFKRLAQANLERLSAENLFQAQSIRSDFELATRTEASGTGQSPQQSPPDKFKTVSQINSFGSSNLNQRGLSLDIKV